MSPRLIHEVRNRLAQRLGSDTGIILEGHLLKPRGINATIDAAAALEVFSVRNEGRPIRQVAEEVLGTVGWR